MDGYRSKKSQGVGSEQGIALIKRRCVTIDSCLIGVSADSCPAVAP